MSAFSSPIETLNPNLNESQKTKEKDMPPYAAIVGNMNRVELSSIPISDIKLLLKQAQTKHGKPTMLFTPLKVQHSEAPLQYALVAKFSKGRPQMDSIRNHIINKWGLSHPPIVGLIDSRHILINMQTANDLANGLGTHTQWKGQCSDYSNGLGTSLPQQNLL